MYWDLNIPYPATKQLARQLALMAIQLGYDGIVWTRTVSGKLNPRDANTMETVDVSDAWRASGAQQSLLRLKQPDYHMPSSAERENAAVAPAAAAASSSAAAAAPAASGFGSNSYAFGQKSRLHMLVDDASQLHSLSPANATLQSYDLVSVFASNEKMFHACCSHESVDIVVIEASRKLPFYLKKPAINLALERGIHFEFSYAPAIRDSSSRRYLFANVLAFLRLTRGRNLVLSSAASKEMELRAPWDVINLGIMCGVDGAISKASISAHARSVLLHAEARKTVKCVLREVKPDAAADAKAARQRPSHNNDAEANKHKDKKFKTDK